MKVLVYIEQRNREIKKSAFEALTLARTLVDGPAELGAVIIGKDISGLADGLKGYGVGTVFLSDAASLDKYNSLLYGSAFENAIKEFDPNCILGVASPMGRDVFPRMAARFGGGIITDIISLRKDGNVIVAKKPMYAGKCIAEIELKPSVKNFVTVRPNVFAASKGGESSTAVKNVNALSSVDGFTTVEIRKGTSEKPDLTEASIIVSGGRSVKSSDGFKMIEECANVLGATVGASRAAVDAGYISHSAQVGQTGKTVTPNLYVACGISGAIQHLAGMRTSKVIVAINTDPDAPIFSIADYGIVADIFEAVPILTQKLKAIL
ncbi:MAG: electron transfer flavoprotein subunit alpha/FixB family protein [Oligoflexales bacterium]|nr:electron transfer flavoprotein subunit alpha/FixB family protein [Oligoflexales bacterium]